jgi:methionyl-tRNA formyltransferase
MYTVHEMKRSREMRLVFFGTSDFAVGVLEELKKGGIIPALVVTSPDRPKGRGLKITAPPVKMWAEENGIALTQPENPNEGDFIAELQNTRWHLFVVAAYGTVLSKEIIDIPKHGTLNVHPSLLPKLRGASPIQSAILRDEKDAVGVTIMLADEKLDHGPIIAQASVEIENWPPRASVLERLLVHEGGKLLSEVIPLWIHGKITPEEQEHTKATYSKKIAKEDGLIDLNDNPYENFKKIQAFDSWPGTYFFAGKGEKKIRLKIIDAEFKGGALTVKKVIPEGKRDMQYADFLKGLKE